MLTIFPNLPSYLTCSSTSNRENIQEKRRILTVERHETAVENFSSNNNILNLYNLKNEYLKYVNSPLRKFDILDVVIAYITDLTKISTYIEISKNLEVTIFKNDSRYRVSI